MEGVGPKGPGEAPRGHSPRVSQRQRKAKGTKESQREQRKAKGKGKPKSQEGDRPRAKRVTCQESNIFFKFYTQIEVKVGPRQ